MIRLGNPAMKKRLVFLSLVNSATVPYGELYLPALTRDGWEVSVIAPGASNSLLHRLLPYQAHFRELPARGFARETAILRVLLTARFHPRTVLYLHSQALSLRAWVWLWGPKFGKRIVYHNPDYYDPFQYPLHYLAEKRLCRKAGLCLNNEFHRACIVRAGYGIQCPVMTAPILLPAAWPFPNQSPAVRREISAAQPDRFVLVLHGGYGERRKVQQLFEALALLPDKFRLVMFMKEHRETETAARLKDLGLTQRVLHLPAMALDQLLLYTVNADAGVLLYDNNDLGNFFTAPGRLTEYLGAGLPVLATNHTGLENLVWRFDIGVTVDSTRPQEIARGILTLEKLQRQGRFPRERMRSVFREHLTCDLWQPEICGAFNELLAPGKGKTTRPPAFPWLKEKLPPQTRPGPLEHAARTSRNGVKQIDSRECAENFINGHAGDGVPTNQPSQERTMSRETDSAL